jgi:Zn-dependent protease with chaperone function
LWFQTRSPIVEFVYYALKLSGLLVIVAAAPLLIRRVWDTTPLSEGPIAEGLLKMCSQQRVKVRELLIWRTGGTMINGAVLGVVGGARYILLTDALLDFLPNHFVQAVMAHEIGHVRCKHVPWLTASLFAASGVCLVLFDKLALGTLGVDINHVPAPVQLGASAVSLVAAIAAFGYVSRRFEWQADAFAVKHLSAHTAPTDDAAAQWHPSKTVTRPSIAAMCGALETVAVANHLPRGRFTFRHGSIATRIDRLLSLEGVDLERLPIDAASTRLKWGISACCIFVVASAFGLF